MNSPFSQASSVMTCGHGLAFDLRVVEIRVLRRGMVAPDADIGDGRHIQAGLLGELRLGAVLVQARHGVEAVARDLRRVVHGDEAIRVAGVAHHQDAHVGRGVLLQRPALLDEDLAVDAQQILALHAGLARHAADEQRPVHAAEAFLETGGGHHAFEQRKTAVLQLHHQALQAPASPAGFRSGAESRAGASRTSRPRRCGTGGNTRFGRRRR